MHATPEIPTIDRLLPFLVPPEDTRHRLFHGRGGSIPELDWLTLDRYPPVLVITLFREPAAVELEALIALIKSRLTRLGCTAAVVQHRYGGQVRTEVVHGHLPPQPVAEEEGLRFLLDFGRGQNLGFFPDMAPARRWLRERAAGANVLNLFAFTCAFSVAAMAGGAAQVVNIDLSRPALGLGRHNHELNGLDTPCCHFLAHDIFRSWKKLHRLGRYDIVVIDPPSEQKGSFVARKDYAKLVRQLHRLLKPEAHVLACLNAPWLDEAFLDRAVLENLQGAHRVERLPLAAGFVEPEADAALKVMHYRYSRPADLPPLD